MNSSFGKLSTKLEYNQYVIDSLYIQDSLNCEIIKKHIANEKQLYIKNKQSKKESIIDTIVLIAFSVIFTTATVLSLAQ
jgi:hypothetical protein